MNNLELMNMLSSIQSEKKSGYVIVMGKMANGFSRMGKLTVSEGELAGAKLQSHSGADAIEEILALSIEQLNFLALPVHESDLDADIPTINSLLKKIEITDNYATISDDLQQQAEEIFEKFFGIKAHKKMQVLVRETPPSKHPKEFLDKCQELVAMMSGKNNAKQHFSPLYEMINTA